MTRHDPLRDAVRQAVGVWHQEDEDEKNDLSDKFWTAMAYLEMVLHSVRRGGDDVEEDVPEVEVTSDRTPAVVEASESPVAARRSGAKNVASPMYQEAFIAEARASMGHPSEDDCAELVGLTVTLTFNSDIVQNTDVTPVTGVLTDVIHHPSTESAAYLVIDNTMYPLNAIQGIRVRA